MTPSASATSPDGVGTVALPPAARGSDRCADTAVTTCATNTEPGSIASNPSPTSPAFAPSRDLFHGRLFDVMLDLETMGNKPGAAIVAIGAVKFNAGGILDRFYCTVDLQSCLDAGLVIDASTVMWWMRQGDEARQALQYPGYILPDALTALREWIKGVDHRNDYCVWGNGADFDNAIIACAYAAIGASLPWDFWRNRCYRTLKSMSSIKIERHGTHHNAVDDAESQALHLLRILNSDQSLLSDLKALADASRNLHEAVTAVVATDADTPSARSWKKELDPVAAILRRLNVETA